MVQEASLDTLALAGAMVASLFAGLTFAFARRRDATPALIWWAAAFAVEALRLALMSAASFPPSARAELIGEGGHVLITIPLLIGALKFFGEAPRTRTLLALACLPVVAMLAGLLDPRATEAAVAVLTVLATGALALTVWLIWRHYRAERQAWILVAAATPALLTLYFLGDALRSFGYGPPFEPLPSGEWGLLVHLALPLLTTMSLVFVTQRRTFQVRLEAEDRLAASEQRFRDIAEVAGDWIWETGPDLRYSYFSKRLQQPTGVDPADHLGKTRRELLGGDPQDPALRGHLADLDARRPFRDFEFAFRSGTGHGGEGHGGEDRPRHLRISGKPIFDAEGVFLGYRGTGSDITWLRRREQALALLVESDRGDRSFFDVAAEALAVGLGYRWSGIACLSDDERLEALATRGPGWPEGVPSYGLDVTPGGRVVASRGYLSFADRVAERFPDDTILADLGVVSYQGQAFLDAEANPLGHVFAMNDRPDKPGPHDRELVGLIARWVGAEFEQRRIKAALAESEQRFRDYADTGADWFWETDMEQRFTSSMESEAATASTHITIGKTREEIHRGINAVPEVASIIAVYMAKGEAFRNLEFRCDDPELGTRWIRVSGKPVLAPDGRPVGYRGSGTNITERKSAELALRQSQARLRDFAVSASDWFWEMDKKLRFSYFSEGFEEKAGIPPEHLLGKTRRELVGAGDKVTDDDVDHAAWARHLADLEAHRPFRNFIHPRQLPNGEAVYLSISGTPVFDGDGNFKGYRGSGANITERKRAELALRRSEAGLADAQRIARLGSWDWNIATDELSWSDGVYRIFDREPNDFEPTYDRFLDLVHPEDRPLVRKAAANAIAGFPYSIDHRIVLPDGSLRIVHEHGEIELDDNGNPAFMHGIVQDVTAHREAVTAVREGERHVRSIMENVADALVTIDEQGTIQSINPATERLFGYEADELIGENVAVLMPAPHRIEHDNYIRRYLATGTASILGISAREVVGQRKDGSPIGVELTASEMWHGGDRLFIGVMRDITERKAAEEALRQKTDFVELSKSVAAAANEALSVEDALQTCVSEVCTHFGWPIGHVYLLAGDGTDELAPSTIWHLTDREKFGAFCSITMATSFAPGIGMPGRILVSREPIWIADVTEDSNFPRARASENIGIKAAFGIPVLVGSEVAAVLEFFAEEAIEPDQAALEVMAHIGKQIGRVIERERAERQLLAAKDTAERADRAKGEFLATISHELRTPLNAIIGFSEVMGQELFGPMGHPTYKEYTEDIRTSGTHLLNIINDILDVTKAQAGMIVLSNDTVDLAEVVETCLRLLGPQAEDQGLSLEADLAPTSIRVRGDRQRLNQVLLNLLSNAIKFTAEGSVTVRLRGDREMGVVLEVIDTGIGIAEHDLERVMEPFTQADSTLSRAHAGTGLGLPLSRVLVELHDGVLTIESTFGRGTVATVRLPGKRVMGRADAA